VSAFVLRPIAEPTGSPSSSRRRYMPVMLAAVALVFALTAFGAAMPAPARAVTMFTTRCDGVALRSRPSTSSTKLATLDKGVKVVALTKVSGGSWRTVCAGSTTTGSSWFRVSIVNYRDVKTRYGVSYVYVASSLLHKLYNMGYRAALCDAVSVRTSGSTTSTKKTSLASGTKVGVSATVSGGAWSAGCTGKAVSGSKWYVIKEINGKSVSSLYGVSSLYAATGLFETWSAEATAPSPTATPKPTATPTPKPSSTPAPSGTPKPSSTPAPTPSATPAPTPAPTTGYWEGIDISHWQGTVDWPSVKGAGKRFAYLKATEDINFIDNTYATNRAQAKAQGIKVGAYHFARPGTNSGDAVAEANWFIKNAAPVSGELLPVLDLEVTGGLSVSQLQSWVKAFMDRVYTLTGVRGAIYVSPSFWSNYMGNTTSIATAGYKVLWVAHWTTGSAPSVPGNNWNGNGWTFWQYTSSGTVAGIGGRVDLDRYRFTSWTKVLIP
jgi:GH25 family lysozyme M1 (1,4-beta-N-acetylmuramidase)